MPTKAEIIHQLTQLFEQAKLRPEALVALWMFLRAWINGEGGTCLMQAPTGRRDLLEVGYRSESWARLAAS